jgi:hypothetical protein
MLLTLVHFWLHPLGLGYDEVYQLQAAGRLAAGNGLTLRIGQSQAPDGEPCVTPVFPSYWPAGYSLWIAALYKAGLPMVVAVKLTASLAFATGCVLFAALGRRLLRNSPLLWWMVLLPIAWRPVLHTRTDGMVWAWAAVFYLLFCRGLRGADARKGGVPWALLGAALAGGAAYWTRYGGIILLGGGGLALAWRRLRGKVGWGPLVAFGAAGGAAAGGVHLLSAVLAGRFGYYTHAFVARAWHWRDTLGGWLSQEPLNALFFTPVLRLPFEKVAKTLFGGRPLDATLSWCLLGALNAGFLALLVRALRRGGDGAGRGVFVEAGLWVAAFTAALLTYISLTLGYTPALHLLELRYYWPVHGVFFVAALYVVDTALPAGRGLRDGAARRWPVLAAGVFLVVLGCNAFLYHRLLAREEVAPLRYAYGSFTAAEREEVERLICAQDDGTRVAVVSQCRLDLLLEDRYPVFRDIPPPESFRAPIRLYIVYPRDFVPFRGVGVELIKAWPGKLRVLRERHGFRDRAIDANGVCYGKVVPGR